MGRSGSTSCFRIMTCGADRFEDDGADIEIPTENVSSSDRRRRRSTQKQSRKDKVQSNTGIASIVANEKEDTETNNGTSDGHSESYTPEKSSSDTEKCEAHAPSPLPSATYSVSYESSIILIQAAVRGFLVQRRSQRLKKVVKLQAAMRGRLVRRQAVATLRCVQAVVKMQSLVRKRLLQNDAENPAELDPADQKDTKRSESLRKESFKLDRQTSTEKLLKNGFARLLLDSKPTKKPVYISCDRAKSESAWQWLERWMTVPYQGDGEQHEIKLDGDYDGRTESFTSPIKRSDGKKPVLDNNNNNNELACSELNTFSYAGAHATSDIAVQSSSSSSEVSQSSSHNNQKHNSREPVETGDKKTTNPSFAAAKSLFEELTSPTSGRFSKFHCRSTSMSSSDILPTQPDSSESGDLLKRFNHPNNVNDKCGHGKHGHTSSLSTIEALEDSTYAGTDKVAEQLLAIPEATHADTVQVEYASDLQGKRQPPAYTRANMGGTELQGGMPSSLPSITTGTDKGLSTKKQRHNVTKKKPVSNRRYVDDSKKEKEINSPRLGKSEHNLDQGPRINKKSPLPSYMQATESARARSHTMNSPKEDTDLPHRDNHTRKKHASALGSRGPVSSSRSKPTISSSLQESSRNKVSSQLCW